jgi:hypothetical protein
MSYLPSFGPSPFSINVVNDGKHRCIQLTPTTNPPNGAYTLFIGHPGSGTDCSTSTDFTARGTLTLDQSGQVVGFAPLPGVSIGGHYWKHMTGMFHADGTGSGSISDDSKSKVEGAWSAGGTVPPLRHPHEDKHGHHA